MKKTILIISGGIEAVPGIKRAREMGCHVVVSDMNPKAPGFKFADDIIIADTYGIEQTIKAAKNYHRNIRPINGVICMAADVPMTVAGVAHELGLIGIPMETALLASDKLAMKKCFAKKGISIPWFKAVESDKHLKSILADCEMDLILKPVDSRGARGVLRLDGRQDLKQAYEHSVSFSPTRRVMVEEFLLGPQVSTESIIIEKKAFTPGFGDRNYEYLERFSPYIIENGGEQPSFLSDNDQEQIRELANRAALAMGISTGIAKGDMVMTKNGPAVIEIAARLSGGWFSTDQIPLGTGVDLIGASIHQALGETIDEQTLIPQYKKGVAIRYFWPSPGMVKHIINEHLFDDVSWIHKLYFFVKPGDIVEEVTDHTKRAGFVITLGEDRQVAIARAREVVEKIKIITDSRYRNS